MMGMKISNLYNVTLKIDGVLEGSLHFDQWPTDRGSVIDILSFEDCESLTISGSGMVDGRGYDWWVREWAQKNKHGRPMLLKYEAV